MNFSTVTLTTGSGEAVRVGDYRHKQHLVLLVTSAAGFGRLSGLVDELAQRYAEFEQEKSEVLVVVQQPGQSPATLQASLPFPVVADQPNGASGKLAAAANGDPTKPAIYVIDRYGEPYTSYQPPNAASVPSADDLLEWLQFIGLQCPE